MVPVKLIPGEDQTSLSLFAVWNNDFKGCAWEPGSGRSLSRHVWRGALCTPPAERRLFSFFLAAAIRLHTNRLRPPPSRRSPPFRRFVLCNRLVGSSAIPRDAVSKRAALGRASSLIMTGSGIFFPRWKVGHRLTESSQRKDIPLGACAAAAAAGKLSEREFSPSLPAYMKGSRHMKRLDVLLIGSI